MTTPTQAQIEAAAKAAYNNGDWWEQIDEQTRQNWRFIAKAALTAAADEQPRAKPMRGLFSRLSKEQQKLVLNYRGDENHGEAQIEALVEWVANNPNTAAIELARLRALTAAAGAGNEAAAKLSVAEICKALRTSGCGDPKWDWLSQEAAIMLEVQEEKIAALAAAAEVGSNWEQSDDGKETIRESPQGLVRATIERCAHVAEDWDDRSKEIAAKIRALKDKP